MSTNSICTFTPAMTEQERQRPGVEGAIGRMKGFRRAVIGMGPEVMEGWPVLLGDAQRQALESEDPGVTDIVVGVSGARLRRGKNSQSYCTFPATAQRQVLLAALANVTDEAEPFEPKKAGPWTMPTPRTEFSRTWSSPHRKAISMRCGAWSMARA